MPLHSRCAFQPNQARKACKKLMQRTEKSRESEKEEKNVQILKKEAKPK